jgi:hypothetical protein
VALLRNSRTTDSPAAAKSAEFLSGLAPRLAACALLAALLAYAGTAPPPATQDAPQKTSPKTSKAVSKKPGPKAAANPPAAKQAPKSAATKTAASKGKASKSQASNKSAAKPAVIRRSTQQQPRPERYREIQQALSDKGYFSGTADGNWGPESVDALKRFQHDQNLTEDGKIGSLSLIALGLGPKREVFPAAEAPQAPTGSAPIVEKADP